MKTLILLGWFFVTSYGHVGVHTFHDPIACEQARQEAVRQLSLLSTSTAKRVSPQCIHDPEPPKTMEFTGTFTASP